MRAAGTFRAAPTTGRLPAATSPKTFTGEVAGRSAPRFTSTFDRETGVGTYVATESFQGTLNGRAGTFTFAHSATHGPRHEGDFFIIVPASGTADLAGISGTGGLTAHPDGTHHIWFDYELV